MNQELQHLVRISQAVASKAPMWTQGPGGNISVKVQDQLLIKASGARLDQVRIDRGWTAFNLRGAPDRLAKDVFGALGQERESLYAAFLSEGVTRGMGFGRASMETGCHLLLTAQWVMHFHSIAAILMAHNFVANQLQFVKWLSVAPSASEIDFVPYLRPGLELSLALRSRSCSKFIVLANHGVILAGESEGILEEWAKVESSFFDFFKYAHLSEALHSPNPVQKAFEIVERAGRPNSPGPFFPDSVVFSEELTQFSKNTLPGLSSNNFCIADLDSQNLNCLEIWLAESLLAITEPFLAPIPEPEGRVLRGLPTEALRKRVNEGGTH